MVCHAILAIRPVGDQNHHSTAFFHNNRITSRIGNVTDVLPHLSHEFACGMIIQSLENIIRVHFMGSSRSH